MLFDVFISYSSDDQKIVEGLSAYLEQQGVRCFVAYRDIPKGVAWAEAITKAIENCKLMIVVFSEHFNCSKQVDREIEMCIEEGKPILTFKIQNTDFKGTKKYFLKNLNWIDAFPNPKEYFGELLKSVQSFLSDTKINENIQDSNRTEKHKINVRNKYLSIGIGIAITFLLLFIFNYLSRKNKTEETNDNKQTSEVVEKNDQQHIELKTDSTPAEKIDKQQTAIVEPEKVSSKHKIKSEDNPFTESKSITFTEKSMLVSLTGEQFEANEGDFFEGEFENGKVVSGRLYDKDKKLKRVILPKRNQ